jgi:signal peptidase I
MARHLKTLAEIASTAVLYFFVTTCLAQGYVIPTGSMESTLLIGDHLIVDKVSYAPPDPAFGPLLPHREIDRAAIVVLRYPLDLRENYVKRVIGLPGDRVRLENKAVFVNGERLDETYVQHVDPRRIPYRDDFPAAPPPAFVDDRARQMLADHVRGGELVVPIDQYFVLGDNRDDSSDSRFWGLVPRENIFGKPLLVFWSVDAPTEVLLDRFSPAGIIDLAAGLFTRSRWDRVGLRP